MIQFVLLQNRQGKTRLSKWYSPYENPEKRSIEREIHQLVVNRDSKFTNFIEYRTFRLVYRRYAGLYFTFCIDIGDNHFAYLEAIHFFVELLDKYFGNVCELDLVFNFYKVYAIIDEFVLAGELQETNKNTILARMGELEKFE